MFLLTVAAAFFMSWGAAAPEVAQAFQGEGAVIKPGSPPVLTKAAEDVLKQPKFLPETVTQANSFAGSQEASGAMRVFQAGKVLPTVGAAVAAFSAGWEVGTEICGLLGIGGCFHLFGSGDEPASVAGGFPDGGKWVFMEPVFHGQPAFQWYWRVGNSGAPGFAIYTDLSADCNGWTPPGDASYYVTDPTLVCVSKTTGKEVPGDWILMVRRGMEGLSAGYNATDDPAVPNYAYTPPVNWSSSTAAAMTADPEGERVGEKVASEIDGSEVANPYAVTVEIPDCDGLVYATCEELLEELGLIPQRESLPWEEVTPGTEPDEVVELDPAKSTEVEKGSTVTVVTNPAEEEMPLVVPAFLPGEGYTDYVAKLAPQWQPEKVVVDPAFIDPAYGPNDVIRTSPKTGSTADPATSHAIDVFVNPADAPPAAGTWSPPTIPALDLSPLAGVAVGCNDFPFGVFCWIADGLGDWGSSGTCSSVDVPVGTSVSAGSELPFDLCQFEPAMEVVRPVITLVAAFCLAWFFSAAAMGLGAGSSDD